MAWRHIWLLAPNGGAGLCGQPTNVDYFSPTGLLQAWPSHGNYDDASILTDGNTGTRVEFLTDINADNPDFFGQVNFDINGVLTGTINPPPTAELVVYYKADRDHRVFIRQNASVPRAVTADAVIDSVLTSASPLGADWRKAPLTFASGYNHQNIIDIFESTPAEGWVVEILPPLSPSSSYHADVESWVSEIAIGYATEITAAPPCRIFPREDGLGVGGGRHFPPAKSQQGSGRRFGYY